MTLDRWIALGSSVGSCVAALATFSTLLEMRRARRAQHLSMLIFPTVYWEWSGKKKDGSSVFISKIAHQQIRAHPSSGMMVRLENVGGDIARNVLVKITYDLKAIEKLFREYVTSDELSVSESQRDITFSRANRIRSIFTKRWDGFSRCDWLALEEGHRSFVVNLPGSYVYALGAFWLLALQRPQSVMNAMLNDFERIWKLRVTVSYIDREGYKKVKTFGGFPHAYSYQLNEEAGGVVQADGELMLLEEGS